MARQRRPAKPLPLEQPSPLHRLARIAADWKTIVSAVLLMGGGVAFAMTYKFATKDELKKSIAPLVAHDEKDDQERATVMRALQDLKENQDRSMQWIWDLHQRR